MTGRFKASQYYIGQTDTRVPTSAGVYLGQNSSTTGYFNINKGTGVGGFNFQTYDANGNLLQNNMSMNASGTVQVPYYSTVTTDSADSETTAMAVFDATGNLVRSYQQNARFRGVENRLNVLEGETVASVPVKVNEIIGRLNTLKIWNTQIAGLTMGAPPAPFNPSPASAPAVQVQLALSVSLATAQTPAFQTAFINTVATNLGISPSRIVISSVSGTATVYTASRYQHLPVQKAYKAASAGSIFINVVINPDPAGTGLSPALAVSTLVANVSTSASPLVAALATAIGVPVVDTGYVPIQKATITATPAPTAAPITYYDFKSSNPTNTITFNAASTVELFMIGGGGGGGASDGGGGGAGAFYYTNGNTIPISAGTVWTTSVGTGGAGGLTTASAIKGGDTYIRYNGSDVLRALGGGGGAGYYDGIGVGPKNGGCGGGGQGNMAGPDQNGINGGAGLTGVTNGLIYYAPLSNSLLDNVSFSTLTSNGSISYYTSGLYSALNLVNTAGATSGTINLVRENITLYPTYTSFTVSCWFNAQSLPQSGLNNSTVFSFGTSIQTLLMASIQNNTNTFTMSGYGSGNVAFSYGSLAVTTNTWYHVVATFSSSGTCTLYANGVSNGTSTGVGILNNSLNMFSLGSICHANFAAFNGYLADFRVYNRILSSSEVSQLYTLYNPTMAFGSYPGGGGFDQPNSGYAIGGTGGGIGGPGKSATTQSNPGGLGLAIPWNGTQMGFGGGGGSGSNWTNGTGGTAVVNGSTVVLGGNSSTTQANNSALADTGSGGGGGGNNTSGGAGSGGRILIKVTSSASPTLS